MKHLLALVVLGALVGTVGCSKHKGSEPSSVRTSPPAVCLLQADADAIIAAVAGLQAELDTTNGTIAAVEAEIADYSNRIANPHANPAQLPAFYAKLAQDQAALAQLQSDKAGLESAITANNVALETPICL